MTYLHNMVNGDVLTSMKYGVMVTILVRPECNNPYPHPISNYKPQTCFGGTSIQPLVSATSLHSMVYGDELTSMKYGVMVTIFVSPELDKVMLTPT